MRLKKTTRAPRVVLNLIQLHPEVRCDSMSAGAGTDTLPLQLFPLDKI